MSFGEHIMICGYTTKLQQAPLEEAKALFSQHLETLRPIIAELDPNENVLSDMLGIDEFGFDDEGVDHLYMALVQGYEAVQEETGLLSSYPFRDADGQERWFCLAGGEGYSEDPFDAWGALWVLLHAIEVVPQFKSLGVYGLGIVAA